MMFKRFLPLALLFAALFGVAGQGVALAITPMEQMHAADAVTSSSECMEMMADGGIEKANTSGKSGNCDLVDCIAAMMTCAGSAMTPVGDPSESLTPFEEKSLEFAGLVNPLPGLSPPPDTHPPTVLG